MRTVPLLLLAAVICSTKPLQAVEGSSVAGPIGGTDMRSALLPPPGLYGGLIGLVGVASNFVDAQGQSIPVLSEARIVGKVTGPFLLYVPDIKVFDGSIGVVGVFPYGQECGRLFAATPKSCGFGFGDPYAEVMWSRSYGTVRPSKVHGASPILEGLTIALGFGVVFPFGRYDGTDPTTHVLSLGNNIWDFAPSVAVTYTTPPIIAEGTEVSAKLYWNNYLTNPETKYSSGSLINLDFAISERIGRFQVGMAGYYVAQVADDMQFGTAVAPDGRRLELLTLGGVLAYDMPELRSSIKVKALGTAFVRNGAHLQSIIIGWVKKFH